MMGPNSLVSIKEQRNMAMVSIPGLLGAFTKATGRRGRSLGKVIGVINKKEILMLENFAMGLCMETELINGAVATSTKARIEIILDMDMANIYIPMEVHIKANGKMEPNMDQEFSFIQMPKK